MRNVRWTTLVAMAVAVAATPALAQRGGAQDVRGDLNVVLKGGVGDYTGDLGSHTATGPAWGVAVNVQPGNILGYELAYDGSRNLVSDDRLDRSPAITRHGVQGLVRLSPPLLQKVKPFVGAGLGASLVRVTEHDEELYRGDFLQEIPVAAGIEFNTPAITAGLRTTWRWLIDESFADPAATGNPQGGYFDAGITLGGRF